MSGLSAVDLTFDQHGAEIISGAVSFSDIDTIAAAYAGTDATRPGARTASDLPVAVSAIAGPEGSLGRLAQRFSAADKPMRPVRIVFFDKTPATNWAVPWHQDRTIAVAERHDTAGFANWNRKDGVDHVEPPVELLSRMLTLRLHLDDTGEENGALDVLPDTHRHGRLPAADVMRLARDGTPVRCIAARGDVLAMRLLTVHKSDRSAQPSRRRVLHVDYSADALPAPLVWHLDHR